MLARYLGGIFLKHNARKRFGQNFLNDFLVIARIISSINVQPGDKYESRKY